MATPPSSSLTVPNLPESQTRPIAGKDLEKAEVEEGRGMKFDELEPTSLARTQSRIPRPDSPWKEIPFVAVLCSAQFMTQAGLAMGIAPLHIIGDSFGSTAAGELSWYAAAYSLTVGTFILIAGRLGDVFGHKKFFVAGFAWFAIWSLIAGVSVYSTQVLFSFARAMQGIGPAFLLPNALAIIGRTYEQGPKQNMVYSLFGATAPGGFVIGAVFSSLFAQLVWWPWAYWVMCFACALLALAGIFLIPSALPVPSEDTNASIWSRIDALGSVLGVIALVLFNFAWNQGSVVGWTVPYTYITLILGTLILVVFLFVESMAAHPLLPLHSLSIDTGFALGCIAAGWSSFGVYTLYYWNFLTVIREQTPLLSSAQTTVIAISGLVAAITTGFLLSKIPASAVMMMAMIAFTVGGILLATIPVHQTYWAQQFVCFIILPWGMDMSFPAATILMSRAMPAKDQGLAASLVNTVLNYSISIGLGIAGTVEYNINNGGTEILKGYRGAWYMAVGLSALGIGVAAMFCLTEWRRLKASRK